MERDEAIEVAKYWQKVAEECEASFAVVERGRSEARAERDALASIIAEALVEAQRCPAGCCESILEEADALGGGEHAE